MAGFQFTLDPKWLGSLGLLVTETKSTLSPFAFGAQTPLSPEQLNALRRAGVLDEWGNLTTDGQHLCMVLSQAQSFARLRFTGAGAILDYAVYFGRDGSTAGVELTPQGLVLSDPAAPQAAINSLKQYTGDSMTQVQRWETDLPAGEGLALATLMDLRRRAMLRSFAEGKPAVPVLVDAFTVGSTIAAWPDSPQWLKSVVKDLAAIQLAPPPPEIQQLLTALVEKNCVTREGDQFGLAPGPMMAADRVLVATNVIALDAGHANPQGKVALARLTWLQAGPNDLIHLEYQQDKFRLQTLAPSALLDHVEHYFSTPDAIPAPPQEVHEMHLAIITGIGVGQSFPVGAMLRLGRGTDCEIQLLDARASRHHALVERTEQGFRLSDLGSTNGTQLNGELVRQSTILKAGDVITIGETQLKVVGGVIPQMPDESERTVFAGGPLEPPAPAAQPAAEPFFQPPAAPVPDWVLPEAAVAESVLPEPMPAPQPEAQPEPEAFYMEPEPTQPPAAAFAAPIPPPVEELVVSPAPPVIEPLPPVEEFQTPGVMIEELPAAPPIAEVTPAHSVDIFPEPEPTPVESVLVTPEPEPAPVEPVLETPEPEPAPGEPELVTPEPWQPVEPPAPQLPADYVPVTQVEFAPEAPAPRICPNCGNAVAPQARFCGLCGNPMG